MDEIWFQCNKGVDLCSKSVLFLKFFNGQIFVCAIVQSDTVL